MGRETSAKSSGAKGEEKEQNISLTNRERLVITGVTDTDKFDESRVLLYTVRGELLVKGRELHVSGLSLDTGEMVIEGEISAVIYGDSNVTSPLGFFGRLKK